MMVNPMRLKCSATFAIAYASIIGIAGSTHAAEQVRRTPVRAHSPAPTFAPPDIQGIWTNSTATPFERPAEIAGQTLTPQQAASLEQRAEDFRTHRAFKPTDIGHDYEANIDINVKVSPTMQSSLIVEPSDGRLPALRPEAERRRDYNLNTFDSYESMSPWDRCITRGPAPLLPANYNNGYQIIQTPTHVVIVAEMIHEARVIPLNTKHNDARIKTWAGDSVGHWEGNTLVVDTINFNDRGWLITHNGAGRVRGVPYSEKLHLIERFTRVNADTLQYEIAFDDPEMFTSPWKVSLPFKRDDTYQIFEYACHEGNGATDALLRGARVQEAQQKK